MVSLVHRQIKPRINNGLRVLELGGGAGANIALFHALGMKYFAIEGSASIVEQLHERYPNLVDQIIPGDFTKKIPRECNFDLILDSAALNRNNNSVCKTIFISC